MVKQLYDLKIIGPAGSALGGKKNPSGDIQPFPVLLSTEVERDLYRTISTYRLTPNVVVSIFLSVFPS